MINWDDALKRLDDEGYDQWSAANLLRDFGFREPTWSIGFTDNDGYARTFEGTKEEIRELVTEWVTDNMQKVDGNEEL
jgi:hypothetical protein